MLRVAVPNKGALAETAAQLLAEAGYRGRRDNRTLVTVDERGGVEFFYLRPRDIATYVGSGAVDVGITGLDLLRDSETTATVLQPLHFADSTFRFAAPAGTITQLQQLAGKRLATSYPKLLAEFLAAQGVSAQLVRLEGAVESAVRLGIADAVADVVSTGSTLKAAGLEVFGPVILESTAVLIVSPEITPAKQPAVNKLSKRLNGVLAARNFVMMEYDLEESKLQAATEICAGAEGPTVAPLAKAGWVAVKILVPTTETAEIMDQLAQLGARAIIVTAIGAARI